MTIKSCWLTWCVVLTSANLAAQVPTPAPAPLPPVRVIAALDVPRYMGTWYEIAKYPNRFQRKCVAQTRAHYLAQDEGRVQVLNSCVTADGSTIDALGLAKQVGPATSAKLQVRFAPAWLSWLPMVWGDYWVIELDADYQLAAVSDAKREYLWVLSRTPRVKPEHYNALLERIQAQGFDVQRLETTPQK